MSQKHNLRLNQYITGIPGIDAQHRELLVLMDTFLDKFEREKSADFVHTFFGEFLGRLKVHFSTEESLLEMTGFSKIAEHRSGHAESLNRIENMFKELAHKENAEIAGFVLSFRAAMQKHNTSFDAEYVDFIENLMMLRKKFSITALRARAIAG